MILACDIGTSSVKTGVIDEAGGLRFFSRFNVRRPSARAWESAFRRMAGMLEPALRRSLKAVAVSGHGPTLVPLDGRARPIGDPLLWYETGPPSLPIPRTASFFLPKVLRYAREQPRKYQRTAFFLPSGEYLCFLLTGQRTTFLPHWGYLPYYWPEQDIKKMGLDEGKFPTPCLLGDEAGRVTRRAGQHTGLPAGTPVYGGGADFLMALLGTGTIEPGAANDRCGTSEVVNYCSAAAVRSAFLGIVPGFYKDTFNIDCFVAGVGRLHFWLKNRLLGKRGRYEDFSRLAAESRPRLNSVCFVPPFPADKVWKANLSKERLFLNNNEKASKGDYARAFFEYIGFSLRLILEEFAKAGVEIETLRGSGGLAKDAILNQIKASLTGKIVMVPEIADAELLGNAVVANRALARYPNYKEAVRACVRFKTEYRPETGQQELYNELFAKFKENKKSERNGL